MFGHVPSRFLGRVCGQGGQNGLDTLLFFYSISITVAFALEGAAFALLYRQSRSPVELWAAVMFGLFIADNLLYYAAEYLQAAANSGLAEPYSPLAAALSGGCVLCYCRAAGQAAGRPLSRRGVVGWAVFLAAYAAAAPLAAAVPGAGFVHSALLTLVLAGAAALDLPRIAGLPPPARRAWRGLVWGTLALSGLSQAENLLRSTGWPPLLLAGRAGNRRFMLELLGLVYVLCGGGYLARCLIAPGAGAPAPGDQEQKKLERYAEKKGLTHREREVLSLVLQGKGGPEIGRELFISPGTVKVHVHNILQKAGCASRTELCRAVERTEL